MNTETRILEADQTETPRGEIPFLFLPTRDLFSRRAERLRFLVPGNPFGYYLAFLAIITDAQNDALNEFPRLPLPDLDEQAGRREPGMPLLDVRSHRRNPAWQKGLVLILQKASEAAPPAPARDAIAGLLQAGESALEEKADSILAGDLATVTPQELPFVAAALQVYWVHLASSSVVNAFGRPKQQSGSCPVCGSHPTAGIVHNGGARDGLRYLSCSLCASEWHFVRIKCSSCESTGRINYHVLEGSNDAIKAESCGDCNSYLKLLYLGKDPRMEATADDLATLSLDMLMDNEGKARGGPNLLFHPGTEP